MANNIKIVARKPALSGGHGGEHIVVDRGTEFVSATANTHSLAHGEWFWGHYFPTLELAMAHFNARGDSGLPPRRF